MRQTQDAAKSAMSLLGAKKWGVGKGKQDVSRQGLEEEREQNPTFWKNSAASLRMNE